MLERGSQRQCQVQAFLEGQAATAMELAAQSLWSVRTWFDQHWSAEVLECCNRALPVLALFITPRLHHSITPRLVGIIRQLHYIIKIPFFVIPPDVQDIDLARVRPRDWLKSFDSGKLTLVRPVIRKAAAIDHFHRPISAHHIPGEPHLTVRPLAHAPEQFVIGNLRCCRSDESGWIQVEGFGGGNIPWFLAIHWLKEWFIGALKETLSARIKTNRSRGHFYRRIKTGCRGL